MQLLEKPFKWCVWIKKIVTGQSPSKSVNCYYLLFVQVQQASDKNNDPNNQKQIWRCESQRTFTTVKEYANYQKEVLRKQKSNNGDFKPSKKLIRFGTNIDLSDFDKWRPQLEELEKLPKFLRVRHTCSIITFKYSTMIVVCVLLFLEWCVHMYCKSYHYTTGQLPRSQPPCSYWLLYSWCELCSAVHEGSWITYSWSSGESQSVLCEHQYRPRGMRVVLCTQQVLGSLPQTLWQVRTAVYCTVQSTPS